MRKDNRDNLSLRKIEIIPNFIKNSDGSCLVKFGETQVVCTASVDSKVPRWLVGSGKGWVTAEYGMLPRSTHERMRREAAVGKIGGRTSEIQRLIGRSLRQAVNLKYIKGKTINIDCDVIQADGGTRTASITGGCIALFLALKNHHNDNRAIKSFVAAVSLGILNNEVILDLDYIEDSSAETDLNLVMTDDLNLIEIQGTGEENPFTKDQLSKMIEVGSNAIEELIVLQKSSLEQ